MKTLILINGNDCRVRSVENIEDAKYQLQRRIEKEGFISDYAYLVDEMNELPVQDWIDEYNHKLMKIEKEQIKLKEKSEYERLKKKYG